MKEAIESMPYPGKNKTIEMIVSLNQQPSPQLIHHDKVEAAANTTKQTKEMKTYDKLASSAKEHASVSPVERSQEPLYTPYPDGPYPDHPKDYLNMPAPGDKKDDKGKKEKSEKKDKK